MLALALAVAGLGLGCTGRKAKCEKARESWAADNRAATAGALEFASEKDRPVIEEAAKKEIAAGEKAYVHLCLKRSDTDIDCLAKGPKMKVDPGCAAAVQKMEADLRAATELSAAAPEAPPTQPEAAAPVPEVNIETLDWSSVPRWTWSLQRSANIARRKTISVDECPEAKALEAMPVVDEFEKNDRAAKVEQLQQICLEARKQMAEKIPHLAVLALPVFRGGEFDFKASQFPMLLPNTTASFSAAAKKAHSTFDAQSEGLWNAYLVDNVFVQIIGHVGEGYGAVALKGLAEGILTANGKQESEVLNLRVATPEDGKRLAPLLAQGATVEILFVPGDPAQGSGVSKPGPYGMLGAQYDGVRGKVLAYRVVTKDVVLGPSKDDEPLRAAATK